LAGIVAKPFLRGGTQILPVGAAWITMRGTTSASAKLTGDSGTAFERGSHPHIGKCHVVRSLASLASTIHCIDDEIVQYAGAARASFQKQKPPEGGFSIQN
jgi:hypothetical protein